jgi:hypothetical protein
VSDDTLVRVTATAFVAMLLVTGATLLAAVLATL